MARSVAAVLVLAAASAQAAPIIGGSAATDGEFPAVAVVEIDNRVICTGALIDPEWVVTAAHCLDPAVLGEPSQDAVTMGTLVQLGSTAISQKQNAQVEHSAATYIDPDWDHEHFGQHDLGLIHMLGAYTKDGSGTPVSPMVVNFVASLAPVGIEGTMVGFGTTSGSAGATAGTEFSVSGQKSESCDDFSVGSGASLDDDNLLCFSQKQMTGTCAGDSGGPVIAMVGGVAKIVGTTSFGDEDCTEYGAYTRTDAEIDFVKAHLPALCDGSACFDPNPPDRGGCDSGGAGQGVGGALLAFLFYRRRSKTSSSPSTS